MTTLALPEIMQLRAGVTQYSEQFSKEELKSKSVDELLSFLTGLIGRPIDQRELEGILFNKDFQFDNSLHGAASVLYFSRYLSRENESISRIGILLDDSVSNMGLTELKENAIKMFTIDFNEYKELSKQKGVELADDGFYHSVDSTILIGISEAKGQVLETEDIRNEILSRDWNLGYFGGMFKLGFDYFSEFVSSEDKEYRLGEIRSTFLRTFSEEKENMKKHIVFDKKLTNSHLISPPVLIEDKTLDLKGTPYDTALISNDRLAVLEGLEEVDEDDPETAKMLLNIYDTHKKELINSVNTELISLFDGAGGMAFNFQGSLTFGTDGVLYVNGGKKRYNKNLEDLTNNRDDFSDAMNKLEELGFIPPLSPHMIVENNGIFYFALQQGRFPKGIGNAIVAIDGKEILGEPLLGYSPGNGSTAWDNTPRLVVDDKRLYFKVNQDIVHIDKHLPGKDWEDIFKNTVVNGEELMYNCIPSNHCISSDGILYVTNQLPEEPAYSIKGYMLGEDREWVFATHVYPENYPGGWASFRRMSIKNNILAYSDSLNKKIHFYELQH